MKRKETALAKRKKEPARFAVWAVAQDGTPLEPLTAAMPKAKAVALARAVGLPVTVLPAKPNGAILAPLARERVLGLLRLAARSHRSFATTYQAGRVAPVKVGVLTQMLTEKLAAAPATGLLVETFLEFVAALPRGIKEKT